MAFALYVLQTGRIKIRKDYWKSNRKKMKSETKQKYWYMTEIDYCVICGREKKCRYRVYEKPEHSIILKETACHGHFI